MIKYILLLLLLIPLPFIQGEPNPPERVEIYFCPEEDCEAVFLENINKNSKCAFYSLQKESIKKKLNEENVLVESSNHNDFGKSVDVEGLMHHKFCVTENKVITGSANPTPGDLYENNNNILVIESEDIAFNYIEEYKSLTGTEPSYKPSSIVKVHFCPRHNCKNIIKNILMQAEDSIYFLTFTFTDQEIAKILAYKHNEGLEVKGVVDSFQNPAYWTVPLLEKNNVRHRINKGNLQHNKLFVVDEATVITGSYNPTRAAHTINKENIIVIQSKEIANIYKEQSLKIYEE